MPRTVYAVDGGSRVRACRGSWAVSNEAQITTKKPGTHYGHKVRHFITKKIFYACTVHSLTSHANPYSGASAGLKDGAGGAPYLLIKAWLSFCMVV